VIGNKDLARKSDGVIRYSPAEHPIQEKQICPKAREILHRLDDKKYEAYLVGGAVRDLLLGKQPKDFDIATSAHPERVRKIFPHSRLIGRRFRLAHIHFGREYLEVATFRAAPQECKIHGKIGQNGRIIHDNVYGTSKEDAIRRDFTINALFYDIHTGDIIDHVNGMKDIKNKRLHLIGDPEVRYKEDPVRMLRGIRFAAKLGFSLSPETAAPIRKMAHLLADIAPARLFDETLKLFHSGHAVKTLELLRHYDLFKYLFPETDKNLDDDKNGELLNFLTIALTNTDKRINSGLPVTPAFLFAVMLWKKVKEGFAIYREEGHPEYQSIQMAASDAFHRQVQTTSVPRRFSNVTREIWAMQNRFIRKDCRSSKLFLENKRFRAAYDFLCLRSAAGEIPDDDCHWWTTYQEVSNEERLEMCKPHPSRRKRSRKKRR
jgi:poly(A) polymerase